MALDAIRGVAGRWARLDAVVGPSDAGDAGRPSTYRFTVGGYRATDLSALVGAVVWITALATAVAGLLPLTTVELFVALAVLVFVPLGLGVAATPRECGGVHSAYGTAIVLQPVGAVAVLGSLALPVGSAGSVALAVPWFGVTGLIALYGVWRLLSRGIGPVPELAVDAALLYVPVGAVALLLHRAGISLRFDALIVLLTVVHYHYAGFVLPLVAGVTGRFLADDDGSFGADLAGRVALAATLVVVVNLALIAVGITFSPLVEVVAVTLFTVAVVAYALLVLSRVVPALPAWPGRALALASVAIVGTMALALAYGYSAFPATGTLISITQMIRMHGTVNAAGFALPALLALRTLDDERVRTGR